jgi:hypothetical protein
MNLLHKIKTSYILKRREYFSFFDEHDRADAGKKQGKRHERRYDSGSTVGVLSPSEAPNHPEL